MQLSYKTHCISSLRFKLRKRIRIILLEKRNRNRHLLLRVSADVCPTCVAEVGNLRHLRSTIAADLHMREDTIRLRISAVGTIAVRHANRSRASRTNQLMSFLHARLTNSLFSLEYQPTAAATATKSSALTILSFANRTNECFFYRL